MATPPPIALDILSMPDTFVIMIVALVVFGPRRLPMIGRQIGKLMYEFRKASNDFKFQMEEEMRNAEEADRRKKEEEARQRALTAAPPPPQLESPTPQASESTGFEHELSPAPEPSPPEPTSIAADSPNSDQSIYPDLAAEETRPFAPDFSPDPDTNAPQLQAAPPAAESATEPAVPRILPPSTGETVAAEPPRKRTRRRKPAAAALPSAPGATLETANPEAAGSEPEGERSEPATHHG